MRPCQHCGRPVGNAEITCGNCDGKPQPVTNASQPIDLGSTPTDLNSSSFWVPTFVGWAFTALLVLGLIGIPIFLFCFALLAYSLATSLTFACLGAFAFYTFGWVKEIIDF